MSRRGHDGLMQVQVNGARLRADVEENATFGAVDVDEGRGRTVLTGSEAERRAREHLVERMEDVGLDVRVDAVGNVAGRWVPEGVDPETPAVAAGSHLDSVPHGGIFDGPLGVYAALEAVRSIREADVEVRRPVEVVSFTEEEGARFEYGLLGSSVAAGELPESEALELTDDEGLTLRERLEAIGFHGDDRIDPAEWDAWLEIHIEQATELERADVPVGIVTAITGITNCRVEFRGAADHAGGTRMDERTDALVAASGFIEDVERIGREFAATEGGFAVATVGSLSVGPGARNVVPGRVTHTIDVRDVDDNVMDGVVADARKSLARIERERCGIEASLERYRTVDPTPMSDRCREALSAAAERRGIDAIDLPSGGGHDTMRVADHADTGMIFVRSRDGISHSPDEWSDWDDCAAAADVLANALLGLAT